MAEVSLWQSQTLKVRQKMFEDRRVAELEDEVEKLKGMLDTQKAVEVGLRKELVEAKSKIRAMDRDWVEEKRLAKSKKRKEAAGLREEVEKLRRANAELASDTRSMSGELYSELKGKLDEVAKWNATACAERDARIQMLELENAELRAGKLS